MGTMRFILGRAGTGKTHACLDAISLLTQDSPLNGPPVVLLVPEQATFQAERQLAERCGGGLLRASVTSFQRIARQIRTHLSTVGHHTMLTSTRLAAMRQLTLSLAPQLKFWRQSQPAAIAPTLLRTLDELSTAGLAVEELQRRADTLNLADAAERRLADKLHDLILLGRHWRELHFAQLDDPKTAMELYRDRLNETQLLNNAQIFIDGFAGFTGQEYAAIAAIAHVAHCVTIALCIDPTELAPPATLSEWMPFASVRKTYDRLRHLIAEHRLQTQQAILLSDDTPHRFATADANPAIAALERALAFGTRTAQPVTDPRVTFVEADTPADEVRLAAETIRTLVTDHSLRYRQISVVMRDVLTYESLIRDVFGRYGIAFFIDTRQPLGRSPLARLILGAIQSVVTRFDSSAVLQFAKSGLLDLPEHDLADLENYVLERGISGERWQNAWSRQSRLTRSEDDESQESHADSLEATRHAIVAPLQRLQHAFALRNDDDVPTRTWPIDVLIDALATFLNDLHVPQRLATLCRIDAHSHDDIAAQVTRQMWKTLREMLAQLQITLAGHELTLARFAQLLADGFTEQSVGVVPSCVDQVLVGAIERSRHSDVAATLVLGFNEGHFPAAAHSDVILDDAERERLAWPDLTRPTDMEEHTSREQYLMYIAMTRANRFLHVSWPQRSCDGQTLFPSRFVRRLQAIVAGSTRSATSTTCIADDSELAARLIGALATNDVAVNESYWATLARSLIAGDTTRIMLQRYLALFQRQDRIARLSPASAASAMGESISISRIQTYHLCPFAFFAKHVLRLQPRKLFRIEPTDLGTFAHDVIRDAWDAAKRNRWRTTMVAVADIDRVFDAAVARQLSKHDDTVLTRSARNRHVLDTLVRQLRLSFRQQVHVARAGMFEPWQFEWPFSLPISAGDHHINFEGRIDRVDRASTDDGVALSVIDYKLRPKKDDLSMWNAGASIQLTAYLYAAVMLESTRTPNIAVIPAMAAYVPLMMHAYRPSDDNAPIDATLPAFPTQGWIDAKRHDRLYADLDPQTSPFVLPSRAVVDADIMQKALKQTAHRIRSAVTHILAGDIAVMPLRVGVRNRACAFCDFRSVCRFDPFCDRYRTVPSHAYTAALTWIGDQP